MNIEIEEAQLEFFESGSRGSWDEEAYAPTREYSFTSLHTDEPVLLGRMDFEASLPDKDGDRYTCDCHAYVECITLHPDGWFEVDVEGTGYWAGFIPTQSLHGSRG